MPKPSKKLTPNTAATQFGPISSSKQSAFKRLQQRLAEFDKEYRRQERALSKLHLSEPSLKELPHKSRRIRKSRHN
jgi:hypothetical protein